MSEAHTVNRMSDKSKSSQNARVDVTSPGNHYRSSTLLHASVGCLVGIIVTGLVSAAVVFLVIWLEEPPSEGEYGDPFSGLDSFLILCLSVLCSGGLIGAGTACLLRRRRREQWSN